VLMAVNETVDAIEFMAPVLQHKKPFILDLVRTDGRRLLHVDEEWQYDKEVLRAAVIQDGQTLKWASSPLQDNFEASGPSPHQQRRILALLNRA
jgi:hypothetical protein